MRGAKLDEFIDQFIKENLNKRQQQTISGFVRGRFKKGRLAIPLEDYAKLDKMTDKPFPSDDAFKKWVYEQGFADHVKDEVLKAVPPTQRVAEDVILALGAAQHVELDEARELVQPALALEPDLLESFGRLLRDLARKRMTDAQVTELMRLVME